VAIFEQHKHKKETKTVKELALQVGFDLVGVTKSQAIKPAILQLKRFIQKDKKGRLAYLQKTLEQRSNPQKILPSARSIIVVALNYYQPQKPEIDEISIYAYGKDYHKVMGKKLKKFLKKLKEQFPQNQFKAYVDFGPVLERAYACLAGLGHLGKNRALITKEFGSWVFLGVVITDLNLMPDKPTNTGCPKDCQICIKSCPNKALSKTDFDFRRCLSYLTTVERKKVKVGNKEFWWGCDICQLVCPLNKKRQKLTKEKEFLNLSLELPQKYLDSKDWQKIAEKMSSEKPLF
jgi:epoxyqueuosine reductase